jgi:hypothetical protein
MDQKLRKLAEYLVGRRIAADFNPSAVDPTALPHVFVLEIEPPEDVPRLRIRLVGSALDTAFQRPLGGRYLEEFIHGPRGADVVEGFHHCALTHESIWMRQVVRFRDRMPRFVEGIGVYLEPARIYGGLVLGELPTDVPEGTFESHPLY